MLFYTAACAFLLFSIQANAQSTATPDPGASTQGTTPPPAGNPLAGAAGAAQGAANAAGSAIGAIEGAAGAAGAAWNTAVGTATTNINTAIGNAAGSIFGNSGAAGAAGGVAGAAGAAGGVGGVVGALTGSSGASGAAGGTGGAGPTATHVCQNKSSSASPSLSGGGCDISYRDLPLQYKGGDEEKAIARAGGRCTGDCADMRLRSIEGARPPKDIPLRHITTPLKSYIKDFSPFVYYNLQLADLDDDEKRILRRLYRGTKGDSRSAFSMINTQKDAPPSADGTDEENSQFAQCVDQIRTPSEPTDPADWAKLVRLKLDNCANQYILHAALDPAHKENVKKYSYDNPANPAQKIGLYSHCQPLRILNDGKNEYHASEYIVGAWKKMLQDPNHRINPKAANEPRLPEGVQLENAINAPTSVPDVRLSMLATTPYEEIIDPTHPFSPRWDFEYNERDKFSPMTARYGGDPQNAVFCAGDKNSKIYKVDVLRFRDETIKFSEKVKQRIDFNANCKANSGLQAYPCCKPKIKGPYPNQWKCVLQKCEKCFGMKKDKPPCATSYTGNPDRASVKIPYLAVHPILRIAGAAQGMMQSLSNGAGLSNLSNLNVQQASALISSNLSLVNSFAPGLPIGAIQGALSGQLNLTANLQGMLNGQINLSNLGGLMNMQGNIFNALGNLNPAQLQGMLSGQLNIMAALPGNLNLGQLSGYLQIPGNLLSNLPQNLNFSQITANLNLQGNIMNAFGNLNVQGALGQLNNIGGMLQNLPASMNLNQLSANISAQIPGFGQLNVNNLTVGDLRNAISAGASGLQNFNPSQMMSQVGPAINSSIQAITQLPGNLSVQNVSGFLNSAAANFNQMPNLNLSNVTASLQTQFGSISGTLNNLGNIGGSLQGAMGNLGNIGGSLQGAMGNLGNIGGSLQGALGNLNINNLNINGQLGNLAGNLNLNNLNLGGAAQQLGAMFSGQGNLLSNLPAGMNIAGIQSMVSGQLGNLMNMAGNINLSGMLNVGQLSAVFSTQLGQLANFGGLTSLSGIAGGLDMQMFGSIPGMGSITGALGGIGGALGGVGGALGGVGGALGGVGGALGGVGGIAGGGMMKMELPLLLVLATPYPRQAACRPDEPAQNKDTMSSQCEKLRAPLTPLNKLKMRYHDPAKVNESELPSGVPEGLQFNDYFKPPMSKEGHMPFMRLHDTGRSIQTSTSTGQDPMDVKGQYTAVVGVGKEAISGDAENKDQRCLMGGWGGNVNVGGAQIRVPDPVTSWTELKLYQSRGARKDGVYCIGRYDKVYKPESTEERVLNILGGKLNIVRGLTGNADAKRATVIPWPLSWRGYMFEQDEEFQFPNFGGDAPSMRTGLDNAEPGDIVLLPKNGSASGQKPGLPRVGVITKLSRNKNCGDDCWVTIASGDDGSAPDSCGMTDAMGQVVTRYFHKPGKSKSMVESDFEAINSDMSCEDQNLQHCVLSTWNEIKVFNPRKNVRAISDAAAAPAAPPKP